MIPADSRVAGASAKYWDAGFWWANDLLTIGTLAAVIASALLAHRFVERPSMDLARRPR